MLRSLVVFALVAGIVALIWYGVGRPAPMPPSPLAAGEKLTCISYAPFHGDQAPFSLPLVITDRQVADDMKRLSGLTSCVRTYAAAQGQGHIAKLAGEAGLKVLQGIWLNRDRAQNRLEIETALKLVKQYPGVIDGLIVGNEALLRGELSAADIKTYLEEVRKRSGLPVTYADVWEFWVKAPELAPAVDFVTIHILPYWEDEPVTAEEAVTHVREIRRQLEATFPGKEILIGEVGWPSAGRMRDGALPSPANQAQVLRGIVAMAKEENWKVNLIEAFDQPWKRLLEGTVGGHWGMFDDASRELKFRWGEPVSDYPEWRTQAGLGIAAAFLVCLAYWLGDRGNPAPSGGWRRDAALVGIALASGLLFGLAAFNLPLESVEPADALRNVIMFALALVVPIAAAYALARGAELDGFTTSLDPANWKSAGLVSVVVSALLAAIVVAALHVALGLVFDPRYKDFTLAALTGPVAALAILAFVDAKSPPHPGVAEMVAAATLAGSALFVIVNEAGGVNWQALWFGILLVVLALTALQARAAPS
jgi:exo-beta-1,3-glucanase (GH17 family)